MRIAPRCRGRPLRVSARRSLRRSTPSAASTTGRDQPRRPPCRPLLRDREVAPDLLEETACWTGEKSGVGGKPFDRSLYRRPAGPRPGHAGLRFVHEVLDREEDRAGTCTLLPVTAPSVPSVRHPASLSRAALIVETGQARIKGSKGAHSAPVVRGPRVQPAPTSMAFGAVPQANGPARDGALVPRTKGSTTSAPVVAAITRSQQAQRLLRGAVRSRAVGAMLGMSTCPSRNRLPPSRKSGAPWAF